MSDIQTRELLDRLRCTNPHCDHKHGGVFNLIAPCHPRAGLDVSYNQETGRLSLECHRCKVEIAQIEVAR